MHDRPLAQTDVMIIGGGLAGLAAADRLRSSGRAVTLLEASDRLGGRTYGKFWSAAGREIDLGGTWLLPSFERTFALLDELGIGTYESPNVTRPQTHFSTGVADRARAEGGEADELRRVDEAIRTAIQCSTRPLSAAEVLDTVPMSVFARDWHIATQRYLAGAPLEKIDASHLLIDMADLCDPDHYATQIEGTTRSLVEALAKRSGIDVHTNSAVREVAETTRGYRVTSSDGATWVASTVILAVPRNTLRGIRLPESLSSAFPASADSAHAGASRKDWFVLDGVAEHFRIFASTGGFGYFRSEARLPDGGMLAVGLAPSAEGEPDVAGLEPSIRAYLPHAVIRDHERYDWVNDPWVRGTWFVPTPGTAQHDAALRAETELASPAIFVAGGDVSPDFPGTIEGAVRTGIAAAERALTYLISS